jgi:hypothetical protein
MDTREGPESREISPAAEGVAGDEVARDERSGRGAGDAAGGFRAPGAPRRTARTVSPDAARVAGFTGEQRLLLLDAWMRSKLLAKGEVPEGEARVVRGERADQGQQVEKRSHVGRSTTDPADARRTAG